MKCSDCKHIETRGANEYCTYHDAYVGWHGCEYGEPKPQTLPTVKITAHELVEDITGG